MLGLGLLVYSEAPLFSMGLLPGKHVNCVPFHPFAICVAGLTGGSAIVNRHMWIGRSQSMAGEKQLSVHNVGTFESEDVRVVLFSELILLVVSMSSQHKGDYWFRWAINSLDKLEIAIPGFKLRFGDLMKSLDGYFKQNDPLLFGQSVFASPWSTIASKRGLS